MPRVKRGFKARRRRKHLLELAKGFYGRSKNTIRQGSAAVDKSLMYAYEGRKHRKRDFRALWNQRINAGARMNGSTYSQLICGLTQKQVGLDRKILADLAVHHPEDFKTLVEFSRAT